MAIVFKDLYEEVLTLDEAISRMEQDIENAECDSITKCRLRDELDDLWLKREEVMNTDFSFTGLNFETVINSIRSCLDCVDFSDGGAILISPPTQVEENNVTGTQLTLDDIEEFRVFEITSELSPPVADEYLIQRTELPSKFSTYFGENYSVTWDGVRGGLSMKVSNQVSGDSVTGFWNVAKVVAILTPDAQTTFGVVEVVANRVLMLTNTPMVTSHPLSFAVDGDSTTAPSVKSTTEPVAEGVLQFFA